MDIFGFTITRTKAPPGQLSSVESRGGWWPIVREPWAGAWQQNIEIDLANVLTHPVVFACVTAIANDIAKCRLRLVELDDDGIWTEKNVPAYSPVLRRPNRYQIRIKFVQCWQISRLVHGNAYVLKQRDQRKVVTAMYVLDPQRCRPLVAPDGSVYYELKRDHLSQLQDEQVVVPASEIIHDVMYPLYHPLVGLGPIHASGLAAVLGLQIQTQSANFFANGSSPGGVLTAPGEITDATAQRIKAYWDANYTGNNVGKVAVLGDGLKYEPMAVTAQRAQLSEQWDAASQAIATAYHVPGYKVGGPLPAYNNIEALARQYYTQALQEPFECMEALLDDGLGLGPEFGNRYGTEFDLDDLWRLDSATLTDTLAQQTGAGIAAINEARKKLNLRPAKGGEEPILQQQNWPLSQIAEREPPDIPDRPDNDEPPMDDDDNPLEDDATAEKFAAALFRKMADLHAA